MLKKIKLVYEIEFTGVGHPYLNSSIEEVMKILTECIIGSLPMPDESVQVKITKKPLDKIPEK